MLLLPTGTSFLHYIGRYGVRGAVKRLARSVYPHVHVLTTEDWHELQESVFLACVPGQKQIYLVPEIYIICIVTAPIALLSTII